MDESLKKIIELALVRGNQYVKGEVEPAGMSLKMAELGVFLLEKAHRVPQLKGQRLKDEFIEVQNKIDDMRRTLFAVKGLVK